MAISMSEASIGLFSPFLRNLSGVLEQAASHAEQRKIDPAALLGMRLYPNMYDLAQQVAEAIRHAVTASALLAGREPLASAAERPNFWDVQGRITAAINFLEILPREVIDEAADRDVIFTLRSGKQLHFTGRSLLLTFSVPQFFFHVTTAYDILRRAGVQLAKPDFLGRR